MPPQTRIDGATGEHGEPAFGLSKCTHATNINIIVSSTHHHHRHSHHHRMHTRYRGACNAPAGECSLAFTALMHHILASSCVRHTLMAYNYTVPRCRPPCDTMASVRVCYESFTIARLTHAVSVEIASTHAPLIMRSSTQTRASSQTSIHTLTRPHINTHTYRVA